MITIPFQTNKSLKTVSTLGIGGPARYFAEIRKIEDMQQILKYCTHEKIPFIVVGKGSNCLFDDRGFDGFVLLNKIDFMHSNGSGCFEVGAGYSFSLLGVQTARDGWSGLEFASGIPASIGGAVFMNAGANGFETCQSLTNVQFVHPDGTLETFDRKNLHFAYRESAFQSMPGAIVAAAFQLEKQLEARQKQLQIIHYRQKTQPYKDKSAGCIFRNPPGNFAGQLIEQVGLKGFKVGGAKVSDMHANFLVNAGEATAQDMHALMKHIQDKVKSESGLELMSEVRIIPYEVKK